MSFESFARLRPSSQLNRILNQLLVYGFDLIHAQLNPRLLASSQGISFYDPFLLETLTCYAMEDPCKS
jgi:hypothetical protein